LTTSSKILIKTIIFYILYFLSFQAFKIRGDITN